MSNYLSRLSLTFSHHPLNGGDSGSSTVRLVVIPGMPKKKSGTSALQPVPCYALTSNVHRRLSKCHPCVVKMAEDGFVATESQNEEEEEDPCRFQGQKYPLIVE